MEFWLQKENDSKFQLPVKPTEFNVSVVHRNTVVNVIQLGDINLMGKTGLREVSLSSFFPAKDYNFSNNSSRKSPSTYVSKIESWRKSGDPCRVIITGDGGVNMLCTIESFIYGERDATGDVYYTLMLQEYKKIKTKKATVTIATVEKKKVESARPTKQPESNRTYTVVKGDCLWKIAKQFYGNGADYPKIVSANQNIFANRSPNLIYPNEVLVIP